MKLSDDRCVSYANRRPTCGDVWAQHAAQHAEATRLAQEQASEISEATLALATVAPVEPVSLAQFTSDTLPATRFRLRLIAEPCPLPPPRDLLDHPPAIADYFYQHLGHEPQEVMAAAYLDIRHRLIGWQELFRGTIDRMKVEPRQVLQTALMVNAHSFLLCHNHPSGDTEPSLEDLAFSERMRDAARIIGIPLTDHMVVGYGGSWTSLRRRSSDW